MVRRCSLSSLGLKQTRRLVGRGTIYRAHFAPALNLALGKATKFAPFQRKKHILDAENIAEAVRGCDTYATQKVLEGHVAKGYVLP